MSEPKVIETFSLRYELSTNCECVEPDENGDAKLDENGDYVPSLVCYGCFDDNLANIKHDLLNEWATANGYELDSKIKIVGYGMTWRGVSGYKISTLENLVSDLSLDSDFTLRFYSSDDNTTLKVVRSSHDELGAGFEFEPYTESDEHDPDLY